MIDFGSLRVIWAYSKIFYFEVHENIVKTAHPSSFQHWQDFLYKWGIFRFFKAIIAKFPFKNVGKLLSLYEFLIRIYFYIKR